MFLSGKHFVSLYCRSITIHFSLLLQNTMQMEQLEHRDIFKIALYICPHFSLRNWGHVPTLPAENLVALALYEDCRRHRFEIRFESVGFGQFFGEFL